jgi:hypothetical protein
MTNDLQKFRDAMPSRLNDDLRVDPFDHVNRAFDHLIDPATGQKFIQPADGRDLFRRDPERPRIVPDMGGHGQHINQVAELQDRRKLITALAGLGAKPCRPLVEAFEVHDAIVRTTLAPDVPDVRRLKAEDATDAVAGFADQLARIAASREAVSRLKLDAYRRIVWACNTSLDDVLADPAVRKEFDSAAKEFTAAYAVVRDCQSIADAAAADDTGEAVAAWHRAVKAVNRLDAVVDLVAGFAAPEQHALGMPTSFRKRLGAPTVLGISAAPGLPADLYRSLQAHGVNGVSAPRPREGRPGRPWSLYGAQLDAGCVLTLPDDSEDLDDRRAAYDEEDARIAVHTPTDVEVGGTVPSGHWGPQPGMTLGA